MPPLSCRSTSRTGPLRHIATDDSCGEPSPNCWWGIWFTSLSQPAGSCEEVVFRGTERTEHKRTISILEKIDATNQRKGTRYEFCRGCVLLEDARDNGLKEYQMLIFIYHKAVWEQLPECLVIKTSPIRGRFSVNPNAVWYDIPRDSLGPCRRLRYLSLRSICDKKFSIGLYMACDR